MIRLQEYNKIYIDPDEPLNSLLQRIQSDDKDKLVIIIHNKSPLFTSQINIGLMKRYAERVDKELIFITNIDKIQNLLAKSGFTVYSDLDTFEEKDDESSAALPVEEKKPIVTSNDTPNKTKKSRKGMLFISILIFCAGAVWFYFNFMLITVEVSPVVKEKMINSKVKSTKQATNINTESGILPLMKKKINLEEEVKVKATGSKEIGVTRATGVLTLINNQQKKITIPQGTVVATRNGVDFKTLRKVTVPKAKVNKLMDVVVGMKAGKAEVNIEALHKGAKGNVSKGRIVKFVNESYPLKIVNPEPTTGGKNDKLAMITKSDLKRGFKKAKDVLKTTAREKIIKNFGSNVVCFEENIQFTKPKLNPQSEVGDLAKNLSITGNIKATSFAVKKEGLKELVFKLYKRELGDDFKLRNSQIAIKDIEVKELTPEEVTFMVKSKGQIVGNINKSEILKEIIGKKVKVAKELLEKKTEIAGYQINPSNQVNLPRYKFGINLMVKDVVKE